MPYWRLSGFYFFYFASLGALIPYWNPYLQSLGFSNADIGELMAVIMITKVISPNIWGWIADHTGKRIAIVRLASLLSVVCFAGVFFGQGFWWMALVMATFSFFWNASLPQFEATTMTHLGDKTYRYNSIRIWGSVGFIITVIWLGHVFDTMQVVTWMGQRLDVVSSDIGVYEWIFSGYKDAPFSLLPVVLIILFTGIWLSSLTVPESAAGHLKLDREPIKNILRRREVVYLFLAVFLVQASHGPYYVFFTRYLNDWGYSASEIGFLWALGVIAEIVVFMFMQRLLKRYSPRQLIIAAIGLTVIRWIILASFPQHFYTVFGSQLFHAASFGIMHAVTIVLIHHYFTGSHQGRGQALYSSISFGLGGAIGSLYAGYLFANQLGGLSSGQLVFYISAGVSFVALIIAWYGIDRARIG